jgi:hypothetical protein
MLCFVVEPNHSMLLPFRICCPANAPYILSSRHPRPSIHPARLPVLHAAVGSRVRRSLRALRRHRPMVQPCLSAPYPGPIHQSESILQLRPGPRLSS